MRGLDILSYYLAVLVFNATPIISIIQFVYGFNRDFIYIINALFLICFYISKRGGYNDLSASFLLSIFIWGLIYQNYIFMFNFMYICSFLQLLPLTVELLRELTD